MTIRPESAGYLVDTLKVRIEETTRLIETLQAERDKLEAQWRPISDRIYSLHENKKMAGKKPKISWKMEICSL